MPDPKAGSQEAITTTAGIASTRGPAGSYDQGNGVGSIERSDGANEVERLGGGDGGLARFGGGLAHFGLTGEPISYVERSYTFEEAWELLSPSTRTWATDSAGGAIDDPFTGTPRRYWYCEVRPGPWPRPDLTTPTADSVVVIFGQRALAVATGTCENFVPAAESPKWRMARYDLPLDPRGVRYDHQASATPNPGTAGAPTASAGPGSTPSIMRPDLAARFGNLPLVTQRFLLHPFLTDRSVPQQESDLKAVTEIRDGRYSEQYWCYLFNARWVAFAYARRFVPYRSNMTGPALWNDSPESFAIQQAPWQIQSWISPTLPVSNSVARV